jgi:Cu+-exporting ATPase
MATQIMVKDPVCGALVDPSHALHEMAGEREFSFCSEECRNKFIVNPGRYLWKA